MSLSCTGLVMEMIFGFYRLRLSTSSWDVPVIATYMFVGLVYF